MVPNNKIPHRFPCPTAVLNITVNFSIVVFLEKTVLFSKWVLWIFLKTCCRIRRRPVSCRGERPGNSAHLPIRVFRWKWPLSTRCIRISRRFTTRLVVFTRKFHVVKCYTMQIMFNVYSCNTFDKNNMNHIDSENIQLYR